MIYAYMADTLYIYIFGELIAGILVALYLLMLDLFLLNPPQGELRAEEAILVTLAPGCCFFLTVVTLLTSN